MVLIKALISHHLAVLKILFATAKVLNKGQMSDGSGPYTVPELLSASSLDNQQGLFKVTMKANTKATCSSPFYINPTIKMWRKLS